MQSEFVAAWRRSVGRMALARQFIVDTEPVERTCLEQVYASRVLMLYASCQYAVQELGDACLSRISSDRRSVDRLPERLRKHHFERAVQKLNSANPWAWEETHAALLALGGSDWPRYSDFASLEGNVWPDRIVQYFRRFTASDADFSWFSSVTNSNGETLESRFRLLVQVRNPLAHGLLESEVQRSQYLLDWSEECLRFLNHVYLTVSKAVFSELPARTRRVGQRDRRVALGNHTVALKTVDQPIRVGDFIMLRARASDVVRAANVVSLMSENQSLQSVPAGAQRVAVGLSGASGSAELYSPP